MRTILRPPLTGAIGCFALGELYLRHRGKHFVNWLFF